MSDHLMQRSLPAFFQRSDTYHAIAEIAQTRRILIYAGAGVTLDRSAVDWDQLVRSLAHSVHLADGELARLAQMLPPLHLASLIVERYRRRFPRRWLHHIVLNIRNVLYGEHDWRGGHFAMATALLCAALTKAGADVLVVTTNFDQYLEMALTEAVTLNPDWHDIKQDSTAVTTLREGEVTDVRGASGYDALEPMTIKLVHIHGIVGEHQDEMLDEYVVLSENDYHDSAEFVGSLLAEHFCTRDVLVLGSSLDDAPLVHALSQSREEAKSARLRRWAVYARQSLRTELEPYAGTAGASDDIMSSLRARAPPNFSSN